MKLWFLCKKQFKLKVLKDWYDKPVIVSGMKVSKLSLIWKFSETFFSTDTTHVGNLRTLML